MEKSILLLPVGGSASRMLGLPKFMLPASNVETLIEKHCNGAIAAGYEEIHIVTQKKYLGLIRDYLVAKELRVTLHELPSETRTMSETLKIAAGFIPAIDQFSVTVGLADTAFCGSSYERIYRSLIECPADFALGLFAIRDDQFGKLGQVEIDGAGKVISMKDKTIGCPFPNIWGLAKIPGAVIKDLDVSDAHVGITIERLVSNGQYVAGIRNFADYYDCGTFAEYRKYLNEVEP